MGLEVRETEDCMVEVGERGNSIEEEEKSQDVAGGRRDRGLYGGGIV